jgi:uncharacterized phage-associated protein
MADIIKPGEVADFLLSRSRDAGEILTNLKLQKLLYYAQAWFMALYDRELFSEDFQAWAHGPVLPSQYHRFKNYTWQPLAVDVAEPTTTNEVVEHLMEIIEVFGTETAVALEQMTHCEKPWVEARAGIPDGSASTNQIQKASMRDYYRSLSEAA